MALDIVGVAETARILAISEGSVRYWHKTGRLTTAFRTSHGDRFFWREDVLRLAADRGRA